MARVDALQFPVLEFDQEDARQAGEISEVRERMFAQVAHGERIGRFLAAEGVRAVIVPSGNRPSGSISGGTLMVDGNAALGVRAYEKAHQMQ